MRTDWDEDLESSRPTGTAMVVGLLGLAVFLAAQALALKAYTKIESRPPAWDQAIHLEIAMDYREAWADRDFSKIWKLAPKTGMPPFPPLYHLGMMLLADPENPVSTSLRINWVYLAILCLGIFLIAFDFRPEPTALAAVIAFSCAPVVQWLYHTQLPDLSVAAWAAAAYYALLKSGGFKKWPGSLAFGALFAVGMMHKWTFFTYMIPAYIISVSGLFERGKSLKVLGCWALALAGFLPWYLTHLPILLPRLLQASADFGVPFWRGMAFFQYFLESVNSLGLPLFLLGWLGVGWPELRRNRERWWIVPMWLVTAYVFWAIVPNRQMRFLLPGLVPLGVGLGFAAWPKQLTWVLAAVQLVLAVNFSTGWIAPITLNLPLQPVALFPSDPPRHEDWKIADVLREADRRRDKSLPGSNLTLVANDTYFNGANFTWLAKREGLGGIRMRGVNSRLCEFSEFVVLKTGKLGSPAVIGRLPEASALIRDPKAWFAHSYQPVQSWALPDQSEAVLYQQKRLHEAPFAKKDFEFQFYTSTAVVARALEIRLGPWDPGKGVYETMDVSAKKAWVRGLTVHGLDARMEGARFVPLVDDLPTSSSHFNDVRLLRMRRLKVRSIEVRAEELRSFLEDRVRGLEISDLRLDGTIRLGGTIKGISLGAELAVSLQDSPRSLVIEVRKLKAGVTPVPARFLGSMHRVVVPLEDNPETPFAIDLAGLTIANGRLTVP